MTKTSGTADKLSQLKGKKARTGSHAVVLDHEAVQEYAQARRVLTAAQDGLRLARRRFEPSETLDELQAIVDEAQARADELQPLADEGVGIVRVELAALPPKVYAALKAAHPPTDVDHKRIREREQNDKAKARWNQAEFAPRLVSECVTDPKISLEDAEDFLDAWGEPEWDSLVDACMNLHETLVDTRNLVFSSGRIRS